MGQESSIAQWSTRNDCRVFISVLPCSRPLKSETVHEGRRRLHQRELHRSPHLAVALVRGDSRPDSLHAGGFLAAGLGTTGACDRDAHKGGRGKSGTLPLHWTLHGVLLCVTVHILPHWGDRGESGTLPPSVTLPLDITWCLTLCNSTHTNLVTSPSSWCSLGRLRGIGYVTLTLDFT